MKATLKTIKDERIKLADWYELDGRNAMQGSRLQRRLVRYIEKEIYNSLGDNVKLTLGIGRRIAMHNDECAQHTSGSDYLTG